MSKNWLYYQNQIISGIPEESVIIEARKDNGLSPDYSFLFPEFIRHEIPFNLEREFIIKLINEKKYTEAKALIEEMRLIYKSRDYLNFIEIFEYHLRAAIHADKTIELSIQEAKKEFNQHTITLVAIIVGVVTLLGTANQIFKVDNFQQGINTFFSITIAIVFLIIITFLMNSFLRK